MLCKSHNNRKGTEHCEETMPSTSISHPMINCSEDLRVCFVLFLQHMCFTQLFASELKRYCIISVCKGDLNLTPGEVHTEALHPNAAVSQTSVHSLDTRFISRGKAGSIKIVSQFNFVAWTCLCSLSSKAGLFGNMVPPALQCFLSVEG